MVLTRKSKSRGGDQDGGPQHDPQNPERDHHQQKRKREGQTTSTPKAKKVKAGGTGRAKPSTETTTKRAAITDFSDAGLGPLLKSTLDPATREFYAKSIERRMIAQTGKVGLGEIIRLANKAQQFRDEEDKEEESTHPPLGSGICSLGWGSQAGEHGQDIDQYITSCREDDEDRKGRMLSHFFYRAFLKYIHDDNSGIAIEDKAQKMVSFKTKYDRIWKDTDTGIVKTKRKDGNTPEPCANSLLALYINQAMDAVTNGGEDMPGWTNEFPLFGSRKATRNTKKAKSPSKQGKGQQDDEGAKQPRCDGLMVMADPLTNNSLRALVMMEAKIESFDIDDDYHSKSNACDAFSRQPELQPAWPLLVFRWTINKDNCSVQALAVVPTGVKEAVLVPLWKDNKNSDSLYNAVMAATLAARDFGEELKRQKQQLAFCDTGKNVAIDRKARQVFKSFFMTVRRNVNLEMIQEHVDPEAKEIKLGEGGSYVQMKEVELALPPEVEVGKFVDVANSLARAHQKGYSHGDIRIDNMMLQSGKLIDWDLAGKVDHHFYPAGLRQIVDGERHPDVAAAIENQKIDQLKLSTDHDWYSLRKAMECFQAKDRTHQSDWEKLIKGIEEESEREEAGEHSYLLVLIPSNRFRGSNNHV